jgi:hypothetical protein
MKHIEWNHRECDGWITYAGHGHWDIEWLPYEERWALFRKGKYIASFRKMKSAKKVVWLFRHG